MERIRLATKTALEAIKPSTTITFPSDADCITAPAIVAISKPPKAASAARGFLASLCFSKTFSKIDVFFFRLEPNIPVPEPVQEEISLSVSLASSIAAAELFPIPISPISTAFPSSPRTILIPLFIACWHSSLLIAGPWRAFSVPFDTFWIRRPSRGSKSCLTPQSTTFNEILFCFERTLTAAPPARKFSTICHVTSLG